MTKKIILLKKIANPDPAPFSRPDNALNIQGAVLPDCHRSKRYYSQDNIPHICLHIAKQPLKSGNGGCGADIGSLSVGSARIIETF
jgi:hypothetical protein